jgi:hypothetical protein
MNDDKLLKARTDGARASSLLNDETFVAATEKVRAELINIWTQTTKTEERERIWQAVSLLEKLVGALVATHDNGKLADAELKILVEGQERRKRFGIV